MITVQELRKDSNQSRFERHKILHSKKLELLPSILRLTYALLLNWVVKDVKRTRSIV